MICIKCSKQYIGTSHKCTCVFSDINIGLYDSIKFVSVPHRFWSESTSPISPDTVLRAPRDAYIYTGLGTNIRLFKSREKITDKHVADGEVSIPKFEQFIKSHSRDILKLYIDAFTQITSPGTWNFNHNQIGRWFEVMPDSSLPKLKNGWSLSAALYEFVAYHEPTLKFLKIVEEKGAITKEVLKNYEMEISQ